MQVSLRSIEPINYSIVDMTHLTQGGRNDGVHDKAAVMDSIPYSRFVRLYQEYTMIEFWITSYQICFDTILILNQGILPCLPWSNNYASGQ